MRAGEVLITREPWVGGTRAAWFQPIQIRHLVVGQSWEEGIDVILELAAERAVAIGANAIVNLEMDCDPYRKDGGLIELKGTVGRLEPLFAGIEVNP